MTKINSWFEVDRKGLAAIAARRNKNFILRELIQNAWDEDSSAVKVEIAKSDSGFAQWSTIRVEDDSPEGFADIAHAYTLFASSKKIADPTKRGRFNLGEKLVLAICRSARIETTKGTIIFEGEERRRSPKRRDAGSVFFGELRMTAAERDALIQSARSMLVPDDKRTIVNGEEIEPRIPVGELDWTLPTEVSGADGAIRTTSRKTKLRVFEVLEGETASLYELGIPVVETGDRWHVDVGQKIPVNMERDNVSPSYLREVRVAVANFMADALTVEDANSSWARDALADPAITPEAAKRLTELRFGDKAVVFDPSDQEANSLAVSRGYTVVHGSQMNASEWDNVRRYGTMLPAGRVTPSPKPFSPDGKPLKTLDRAKWTPGMIRFARFVADLGVYTLGGRSVDVVIADDPSWQFTGAFGRSGPLYVNRRRVGAAWFEHLASAAMNDFIIHEFGHHFASDHLSSDYHDALTRTAGAMVRLAIDQPEVFK